LTTRSVERPFMCVTTWSSSSEGPALWIRSGEPGTPVRCALSGIGYRRRRSTSCSRSAGNPAPSAQARCGTRPHAPPDGVFGFIRAKCDHGQFGLHKPSLQVPPAGRRALRITCSYQPDSLALERDDYVRNRNVAIALGKAMFWTCNGNDGVQSAHCHFNGTDGYAAKTDEPNHSAAT